MIFDIRACQQPSSSWCTGKKQIGFQTLLQDLTVPATCFILCQRDCSTSTSNLLCPVWNKGSSLLPSLLPNLVLHNDIASLINCEAATMPSSAPQSPTPYNDAFSRPDYSADYSTLASSSRELPTSAPIPVRREPLAFAGIRHRMEEDEAARVGTEARHSELPIELHLSSADGRSYRTVYPGRHDQLSPPSSRGSTPPRPIRLDIAKCKRTRRDHFADHEA